MSQKFKNTYKSMPVGRKKLMKAFLEKYQKYLQMSMKIMIIWMKKYPKFKMLATSVNSVRHQKLCVQKNSDLIFTFTLFHHFYFYRINHEKYIYIYNFLKNIIIKLHLNKI